ncbi:MAG: pseudouridine synthase, partial [Candidatus Velthaea sp.]
LRTGLKLGAERSAPVGLRVVATRRTTATIDITLHEGKNRQVRRMFEEVGHPVLDLVRLRFGPIALGALAPGTVRPASARETKELRAILSAARAEPA